MVPATVTYSIREVVEEWLKHSQDGYGPNYTDPVASWKIVDLLGETVDPDKIALVMLRSDYADLV